MTLTFKEVSEIMKIIDASDCEEVVLELEGLKLVVRRGGGASAASGIVQPVAAQPMAQTATAEHQVISAQVTSTVSAGTQVRAPMVGSFYRRPGPDQSEFVDVGTRVEAGDPLCLIEVMKLYTTISAPIAGTVKQIAVEDAQLVEFDQLLFVIEPD